VDNCQMKYRNMES